ncbi:App1 family protein [Corynebacterium sp. A21]|uniref:App1 family protein n=1 Tax=Corynebacterium sp. A21 TaxID=3457318 RepID=UPI003FD58DD8
MAISDIVRKLENGINRAGMKRKTEAGWQPTITGFSGYGSQRRVRVLARVLMADQAVEPAPTAALPHTAHPVRDLRDLSDQAQRGWRQFFTIQVGALPVTVTVGDSTVESTTDANGYIDVLVEDHGLAPGWHGVRITAEGGQPAEARVLIVDSTARIGLISDIDDTVMVTWLPRALLAAWNSWVRHTNSRKPVPGMSTFYAELLREHPEAPVFYLSTGAWNTYETLEIFLARHRLPAGPLLLTDWGPTPTGMFRSGQEHKKVQLRNLIIEYPDIQWILVGDDGQHDPLIYGEAVAEHPDRIAGVAIRQLTPSEHVLSHGTTAALAEPADSSWHGVPTILGKDGHELLQRYREKPFPRVVSE